MDLCRAFEVQDANVAPAAAEGALTVKPLLAQTQLISHDLVSYIDAHYRTIPCRLGRGLVGHSMGGYGATRIGMKHADVFGSLYIFRIG